jgi:hypothetical protein
MIKFWVLTICIFLIITYLLHKVIYKRIKGEIQMKKKLKLFNILLGKFNCFKYRVNISNNICFKINQSFIFLIFKTNLSFLRRQESILL